jgi:hypothetical protein
MSGQKMIPGVGCLTDSAGVGTGNWSNWLDIVGYLGNLNDNGTLMAGLTDLSFFGHGSM